MLELELVLGGDVRCGTLLNCGKDQDRDQNNLQLERMRVSPAHSLYLYSVLAQ
jgi:hypothetical protein